MDEDGEREEGVGRRPLSVLPEVLAVCRLDADAPVPGWARVEPGAGADAGRPADGLGSTGAFGPGAGTPFLSVTRTSDELSVVCPERGVPDEVPAERGWRALQVEGPLDFALTGVLASIATPLAEAGIPIFAVSTHDTDYVLVKDDRLGRALDVLSRTFEVRG